MQLPSLQGHFFDAIALHPKLSYLIPIWLKNWQSEDVDRLIQESFMNAATVSSSTPPKPNRQAWYRPTLSPEHGVYIMLTVAFLTGAAVAHQWHWPTTLACISAFCGFQAEHPLILQIKQRSSLKPRFLVWGGVYGGLALVIALYLYSLQGMIGAPLGWVYGGAIAAVSVDAISVFFRAQKSIWNELITFAGVCLAAPFAYIVTTGTVSLPVLAVWVLNSAFFSSTIFTVKFRKDKTHALMPSLVYHAIATVLVTGLWWIGWLPLVAALAFGVALIKYGVILWQRHWYCTTKIQFVAMLETGSAIIFLILTALAFLPAHL